MVQAQEAVAVATDNYISGVYADNFAKAVLARHGSVRGGCGAELSGRKIACPTK